MTVATDRKVWSDEEFMALPKDGHRYEVVDGELIDMGNSGMEHGNLGAYLGGLIELHVRPQRLGVTCDSSTAFKLKSGNRRSPDVSFVAMARLQGLGSGRLPTGYFEGAPDLAVEILSPENTVEEIHSKIVEYFENGTRLVWVIHPDEQYVLILAGGHRGLERRQGKLYSALSFFVMIAPTTVNLQKFIHNAPA